MKHFEKTLFIPANHDDVFNYANNHANFSSHINKPSVMMGGGKMKTLIDEGNGQKIGSHIRLNGKVFGVSIFLDEVITTYEPPNKKPGKLLAK